MAVINQCKTLLKNVFKNGTRKADWAGPDTLSIFGYQMRFGLQESFCLTTTKKLQLRSTICELARFPKGVTNKVSILDEWADENGELNSHSPIKASIAV